MVRCINIDWLEVYCLEPFCLDATYYEGHYLVDKRSYGTPTYEEMFLLRDKDTHLGMFEVRRQPRRNSQGGQFLREGSCHIKLCNRFCYYFDPINLLRAFLAENNYTFVNIKRIDICNDFCLFDNGTHPYSLIADILAGRARKINQCNIAMHGVDGWNGQYWNSIKWGSESSNITTKLYNKSKELKDTHPKEYIQDAWKAAGITDRWHVWRVEFSIKGGKKGWKHKKSQEFYNMQLSSFDQPTKLLWTYHNLCSHYFAFKAAEYTHDGKPQRKDRCKDIPLFAITPQEKAYRLCVFKETEDTTRMDKIVMRRLFKMATNSEYTDTIREAARQVAEVIEQRMQGYLLATAGR